MTSPSNNDPCQDAKDIEAGAEQVVADAIDMLKAASRTRGALCDCPGATGTASTPEAQAAFTALSGSLQSLDNLLNPTQA